MSKKFSSLTMIECGEAYKVMYATAEPEREAGKQLAEAGKYGNATSLLIISIEEYVKSLLIFFDSKGFQFRNTKGVAVFFRNHQIRYVIAFIMGVMNLFGEEMKSCGTSCGRMRPTGTTIAPNPTPSNALCGWRQVRSRPRCSWYSQLIPTLHPDLTGQSEYEQELLALNLVSLPRQVAVWVSEPGRYELDNSLQPLGVTIFPGTEMQPGITPLQVQGGVMSVGTSRPRAVWAWLNFLSDQPLARGRRAVPARPSVAQAIDYWQTLIPPLRQPMLTAFANSRPIRLEEQEIFGPAQLEAVLTGELEAFAARVRPSTSRNDRAEYILPTSII